MIGGVLRAESFVENLQEILGVEAVAQIGDEADVLLGGASQVENGEAGLAADIFEELFEPTARAG